MSACSLTGSIKLNSSNSYNGIVWHNTSRPGFSAECDPLPLRMHAQICRLFRLWPQASNNHNAKIICVFDCFSHQHNRFYAAYYFISLVWYYPMLATWQVKSNQVIKDTVYIHSFIIHPTCKSLTLLLSQRLKPIILLLNKIQIKVTYRISF